MESRQKSIPCPFGAQRGKRRRLCACASFVLALSAVSALSAEPYSATDFDSLKTGLSESRADGIQLALPDGETSITLSGSVPVQASNVLNLNGFGLTQNGQSISFGSEGKTLQITDSAPSSTGSALDFTSFTRSGATSGTVSLKGFGATFGSSDGLSVSGLTLRLESGDSSEAAVPGPGSVIGVTNGLNVSNGVLHLSGSSLTVGGDLALSSAASEDVTLTLDGTGVFTMDDGMGSTTEKATGSAMSVNNMTVSGAGKTIISVADGGTLSVTNGATIGSADSGHVDISLKDASTLVTGTTLGINLRSGDRIALSGASTLYSTGAGNLTAAEGNSTVTITDDSVVSGSDALFVGANQNAQLTVTTRGSGTANKFSNLSASGDFTVGGAGKTTINAEQYSVLGTTADMVIGDTAGGEVILNITGSGSKETMDTYLYVGDPNYNAETATAAETGGHLTIAKAGSTTVSISNQASIIGKNELTVAEETGADAQITLTNGTLQSTGNVTLGAGGSANVSGSGSLLAGGKLVVGQKNDANGSVELFNSYVESAGLVVAEEEGSSGSLKLSGSGSLLHVLASDASLSSTGNGTIEITGVTSTDYSSCVYLESGAKMMANDGITLDNSYLYVSTDSLLAAQSGGIRLTNGSILNGYASDVNATGDLSIKDSTYVVGLGVDGSGNQINVTDGKLSIENSKLEIYFTQDGNITGSEWTIAEIDSEESTDVITGEWNILSPLEIYTFDQLISEDGKTQKLTMALKNEYFNVRANSLQLARQSLWNAVDDRVSWNADGQVYCGQKSPFFNYDQRSSFWAKMGYRGMDVKGSNGYNMDAFNLTAGVDCAFEEYLAAGAFFNFSNPELEEDHETAEANNYSFGLYGGYKTWGGFELKGMVAYTFSDYDLNRNMSYAGTAETGFYGSAMTASVEIARPFIFGNLMLRPIFAVDTECVWQDDAVETGSYAMVYEDTHDSWTFARLGAKADFLPAQRFVLRGKAFYAIQLDDQGATKTVGRFAGDSNTMQLVGAEVGDDYFNVGLSAAFMWTEQVSIFADYDGYYADESESHLVHGGFQVNF